LDRQQGGVTRVVRDPPRNMQHPCLVELEIGEAEFQKQRGEGALGDRDTSWPRVDAVYEAEQPLDFDLVCRMGSMVKLVAPEKADEFRGRGSLRFVMDDLAVEATNSEYLRGMVPIRNVYLQFCFDKARPSRAFCGIFAPALAEAWVCFAGLGRAEGESMRPSLEQALAEQLTQAGNAAGVVAPVVHVEVSFVVGRSLTAMLQWADQRLQDVRRREGGSVCVLCSQLPTGELRGVSPSFWVEQRQLRHLAALREMPVCRAPFAESDANFPALDWPRWIGRRFAAKVPQLFGWWRQRVALCRAAGLPVCNAPEMPAAAVPAALDAMFARQLQRDSQLRWASPSGRPDLGDASLSLVDGQENSVDAVTLILDGKDLSEGRGGGQINNPGTYRSICLEMNLRTKLCICALQHARHLSEMEGGELSRKMIRKVQNGADATGNCLDHTSEAAVSSIESLVTMVQEVAALRDAREAELIALRQAWAGQGPEAAAAVREAGISLDAAPADEDAALVESMARAGHTDAHLAAKLQELRVEHEAQTRLLDGLYGWLASPTSLLYDAALLRKVHQYMDKVLQLLVGVLKRNGCSVIHASYTKVMFATGKLRVLPDVQLFWQSLCDNVRGVKPLEPLALSDASCLSDLHYGVIWMDPANWAGVPIDGTTGNVIWKAKCRWKMADFLPPAVRPSLLLYAGDLLLSPQSELGRRHGTSTVANVCEEVAEELEADQQDQDMDDEAEAGDQCMGAEEDDGEGIPKCNDDAGDEGPGSEAAAAAAAAATAAATADGGADSATKNAQAFEDLRNWVTTDFFADLRRRVLNYIDEMQAQQQQEASNLTDDSKKQHQRLSAMADDASESSEDEDEERGPTAEARKAERLRRHLEQKWSFPDMPGRRFPPESVELEFMRSLIQIFELEDWLKEETSGLRDRMCKKLGLSNFTSVTFKNPCFPMLLRDLSCPWCCVASHVDVTSHPSRGPGLWVCLHCDRLYDKDAVQAQLVSTFESIVQAWQSQEITCMKCKRLNTTQIQTFCSCFGRFRVRFDVADFRLLFRVLKSLVLPHDLPWLGEVLDMHEPLLV